MSIWYFVEKINFCRNIVFKNNLANNDVLEIDCKREVLAVVGRCQEKRAAIRVIYRKNVIRLFVIFIGVRETKVEFVTEISRFIRS